MSTILNAIPAPLTSFFLTLLLSVGAYVLRPRVKLIWGLKNIYTHVMRRTKEGEQPLAIHTAHYVIQNSGRASAKDVEIVFNYAPDETTVWPQRQYTAVLNREARLVLRLDFIAPGEFIDVSIININKALPELLSVQNPEIIGKQVNINYVRAFPTWVYILMWASMFLGVVFIIEKIMRYLVYPQ